MCILSYIYGSYSLELGEDIELFYVVQDFCLVTVDKDALPQLDGLLEWMDSTIKSAKKVCPWLLVSYK